MSEKSKIEWTDATWNPVRGCTKISAGCAHCYAQTFAERFRGVAGRELDGRTYDAMPAASQNPIASDGERLARMQKLGSPLAAVL